MKVPFQDLSFMTREVKADYLSAIERLLDRGSFILGPVVEEFEKRWAEYLGVGYCIGVSNGADALYLSLLAIGTEPGDEVITQGNAYNASVTAILRAGASPRFADIDPASLQIDCSKVEALVNSKTKVILPVHLYGLSGDMGALLKIAEKHHLKTVEDCAQSHGAEFAGKKLGTFGQVSAFSFYPTKNLGAFGDAGAVVTNDAKIYEHLLALRNLGQVAKNDHQYLSTNMRLDPIQAAALSLKLKFLDKANAARAKSAKAYNERLAKLGSAVKPLQLTPKALSAHHLYVVILPEGVDRKKLQRELLEKEIQTAVHYPTPVYRQPFFQGPFDKCTVTDDLSRRILSLPIFYGITDKQQEYVVDSLAEGLK